VTASDNTTIVLYVHVPYMQSFVIVESCVFSSTEFYWVLEAQTWSLFTPNIYTHRHRCLWYTFSWWM